MQLVGSYDFRLVAVSIAVAALASYTALDLASRVRVAPKWSRHAWLAAAAFAMGGGIWSMHFIGMLAFSLPGMDVNYDWTLTLCSLLLPIVVTSIGFFVAIQPGTGRIGFILSGLVMGLGIVAMHYTGMAAMQMGVGLHHDVGWVIISVVIAVCAATIAIWLAFQHTSPAQRVLAALVMGIAISGMHYSAMQGAVFTATMPMDHMMGSDVDHIPLALWLACTTIVILILGIVAAIYDRRLAHRAQQEVAALRQIFETSHLYQGLMNADGILTYINATALAGIKAKLEDVINRPFWETPWFTATPGIPDAVKAAVKSVAVGNTQNISMTLDLPVGVRSFEFSLRPVKDHSGKVTAMVPEAIDITAHVKSEQALRQAQKMEAIGNLTGGIAHDFNNLLMAVLGSLELLKKRMPDDAKAVHFLDNAVEGAKRGAALTQRMLSFARRQDLKPGAIDLPDLVRGMTELLTRVIGPSVRIETHFPLALPKALVDANQLELALLNLVVNARDAMPSGGTITIAAHEEGNGGDGAQDGYYVCLSVTDTGEGMDEQTLARAQEPFFTTKGVGKGTGLGLSMVSGLAEQSNGRFVLTSRLGSGTTAEIWMPATEDVAAEPGSASVNDSGNDLVLSLSVLVVDDDPLVLENTVAMLEDLGHRAIGVQSAEQAIDLIRRKNAPDLVITDHAMPGMTGSQLAECLRNERPWINILLATGFAELPAGVASSLPRLNKPFDQRALTNAMIDATGLRQRQTPIMQGSIRAAVG